MKPDLPLLVVYGGIAWPIVVVDLAVLIGMAYRAYVRWKAQRNAEVMAREGTARATAPRPGPLLLVGSLGGGATTHALYQARGEAPAPLWLEQPGKRIPIVGDLSLQTGSAVQTTRARVVQIVTEGDGIIVSGVLESAQANDVSDWDEQSQ